MSYRLRAVEHKKCAAGLAGESWILLNYTRIESAHKVQTQENYQFFVMYRSPANVYFFPYRNIIKCMNPAMLTTTVFELVQHFYHGTEIANVANAVCACADQP